MSETAYQQTARVLSVQLREAVLDHKAFEKKVKPCELSNCKATCCYDGVYLSEEEAEGITELLKKHSERFADYGLLLPDKCIISERGGKSLKTATRSAELGELAVDFPEHFPKTRCVFLDKQGRCGIQRLSQDLGRGPWFDKPITCWLHPISVKSATSNSSRPELTLYNQVNDPQRAEGYPGFVSCTHCGRENQEGVIASVAFETELEMLAAISGRDFLAELNAASI